MTTENDIKPGFVFRLGGRARDTQFAVSKVYEREGIKLLVLHESPDEGKTFEIDSVNGAYRMRELLVNLNESDWMDMTERAGNLMEVTD